MNGQPIEFKTALPRAVWSSHVPCGRTCRGLLGRCRDVALGTCFNCYVNECARRRRSARQGAYNPPVPETLVLPLRNNLLLTITGQPSLRALAGFLSAAIIHFKNQQDIQQVPFYTAGSFQGRVGTNDCAISHPGDTTGHYLEPAAWLEALRDVHGCIDALEEVRANLPLFRKQGVGEGRSKAVIELLEQPSPASHLAALGILLLGPDEQNSPPQTTIH
jgi:hypothetical protein